MASTCRPVLLSLLFLLVLLTAPAFGSTLLPAAAGGPGPAGTSVPVPVPVPAQPSAYEMLEGFGFPRGILPEGVTGYTYRASDGAFEVFMDGGDCEFEVDGGYRLTYRRRVHGNVAGGSIRNLGGVSVRMFLFDWSIDRVAVEDAARLVFYVGPLSQEFPADNFGQSPRCRRRRRGSGNGVGVAAV